MHNLLAQPLFNASASQVLTLPGLFAALARDEIDHMMALRPHQMPAWHMFTVQLAALALARADRRDPPDSEGEWKDLLRGLTADFPQDEPWCLVVEDWSRPAFLQPPVPAGVALKNEAPAPDALDLLITSKNHDLKQALAREAGAEDWVFALVSLQTGEGYGGAGNHGIARMNGGSSSRPMLSRAPVEAGKVQRPRSGAWFRRDLAIWLDERNRILDAATFGFAAEQGLGLTWLAPWHEGAQLSLWQLDPMFIDACRRVRLWHQDGRMIARKGKSAATRIAAREAKGNLGDIWAPIHKTEAKSLTLGDGDFDYRRMADLLADADWQLPASAQYRTGDGAMVLVAAALARGNSRTDGYRERIIPLRADVAELIGLHPRAFRDATGKLIGIASELRKLLRGALALAAAGGDGERRNKGHYRFADVATAQVDRFADAHFFPALWEVLAATVAADADRERRAVTTFIADLWDETQRLFETALPSVPCKSLLRPRAEAKARGLLRGSVMKRFGEYLQSPHEVRNVT